jgi:branched-chain amino acid transport system substrate-binding protein
MTRLPSAVKLSLAALALALGACGPKAVQFGAVLPLTGQWSVYGEPIRKGLELAYEEARKDASLGYEIELLGPLSAYDSQSNPQTAAQRLEQLYDAGALAVIGGVTTDEALAMVPVMDKAGKVLLSPTASTPKLTGISSNFFRIYPSDFREGSKMGNFAAQTLGLEKIVILGAEDSYARGIQDVFKTEFERYGGQVPAVVEYPPGHTEFFDDVQRALAQRPQAVYVADYAYEIGSIVKEVRRQGFDGRILTTHAFAAPGIFAEVGAAADGVLLTRTVFDPKSAEPIVKRFVDAYRAKYREEPDAFAAQGYDALKTFLEALKLGGNLQRDFWKGMRQANFDGAAGHIQFDERGDVGKFPRVYQIRGGELIDFEAFVEGEKERIRQEIERIRREAARRAAGAGAGS